MRDIGICRLGWVWVNQSDTTIMENQLGKQIEHEMETGTFDFTIVCRDSGIRGPFSGSH